METAPADSRVNNVALISANNVLTKKNMMIISSGEEEGTPLQILVLNVH
jgi:hypothetical protein